MDTNNFKPFFNGYLRAVVLSLVSLQILILLSTGVLDWFFFVYVLLAFLGSALHFFFVFLLYIFIFPLITTPNSKVEHLSFRKLMDKYIPVFAISFAILLGFLWMNRCLNKFFTFVILDTLFTCYIGLYQYVKNKCKINETA